jgi:nucleoside-diphosphate-sugar epimerase
VLEENLVSSVNVLRLGLPMVSFCSGAIYGRQESIFNANEKRSGSLFPLDFYGQSKFLFRQLTRDNPEVKLLRFFNVFGISETPERFLRANITRYWARQPMRVHQDFYMDFFYVRDTVPILKRWLTDEEIPSEINLVYQEKLLLSEICGKLNRFGNYQVDVQIDCEEHGSDYCGDGSVLASMGLSLNGLDYGLEIMFSTIKGD